MVHGDVKLVTEQLLGALNTFDGNHKDKAMQKSRYEQTAGYKTKWAKERKEKEDGGD